MVKGEEKMKEISMEGSKEYFKMLMKILDGAGDGTNVLNYGSLGNAGSYDSNTGKTTIADYIGGVLVPEGYRKAIMKHERGHEAGYGHDRIGIYELTPEGEALNEPTIYLYDIMAQRAIAAVAGRSDEDTEIWKNFKKAAAGTGFEPVATSLEEYARLTYEQGSPYGFSLN